VNKQRIPSLTCLRHHCNLLGRDHYPTMQLPLVTTPSLSLELMAKGLCRISISRGGSTHLSPDKVVWHRWYVQASPSAKRTFQFVTSPGNRFIAICGLPITSFRNLTLSMHGLNQPLSR
jgi:hypothetical protein